MSVTSGSIYANLHVPAYGLLLLQVKCDKEYVLDDYYSAPDPYSVIKSDTEPILVADVRPQWRAWVELVQYYLQLETNATSVDRGTLRAAVAIRRGVRINWALPLAQSIHRSLVDFKNSAGDLQCASYIFTLVDVLCPKIVVLPVLPKMIQIKSRSLNHLPRQRFHKCSPVLLICFCTSFNLSWLHGKAVLVTRKSTD